MVSRLSLVVLLGSILSTLNARIFAMFVRKIRTFNVDEIDTWCQICQHFTQAFIVQKCFFAAFL